jgi:hypothetical protein
MRAGPHQRRNCSILWPRAIDGGGGGAGAAEGYEAFSIIARSRADSRASDGMR